jgi:hypothetical protein
MAGLRAAAVVPWEKVEGRREEEKREKDWVTGVRPKVVFSFSFYTKKIYPSL